MRIGSAAIVLALASVLLVGVLGSTCDGVTRAECPSEPSCRIVTDQDGDGEIADDLRSARNELLYGPSSFSNVTFYSPEPGTYSWTGEVRFCGDATPPVGPEEEPDCDGFAEIPEIVLAGDWESSLFEADCAAGDTTPNEISACLWIGDTHSGDAGAAEPRPQIITSGHLRFLHVEPASIVQLSQHPIYAIWLDGVSNSSACFEVNADVFGGWGAYVSARDSLVSVRLLPGDFPSWAGLVLDGDMSGSLVDLDADFSGAPSGLNPTVLVGSTSPFIPFLFGGDDACTYGPDPAGSCSDFTLDVSLRTPDNDLGGEGIRVWDGNGILLRLDVEYLTAGHNPLVIDIDTPGAGEVTVEGSLIYSGLGEGANPGEMPGILVASSAEAHLDLTVDNVNFADPECYALAGPEAIVVLEPGFQCLGTGAP